MRVDELIKRLEDMPRDAEVIIVGCYASSGEIEDVDYGIHIFEKKPVVKLYSDICSG